MKTKAFNKTAYYVNNNIKTIAYRTIALIIGALCLACTFLPAASAVTTVDAFPTGSVKESGVRLNGEMIICSAYNIGGANYFKLRDIMQELDISVVYDGATNTILIDDTKPYVPDGTETATKVAANAAKGYDTVFFFENATPTTATVKLNGEPVYWDAYNIRGSNHFKLRDIGEALNVSVEWEEKTRLVLIDTSRGYGEEKPPEPIVMPAPPTAEEIDEMRLEIVRLINIERVNAGLDELKMLPGLMACAQAKADDMIENNYYGHDSPVYGDSYDMIRVFAPYVYPLGENIGGGSSPKSAVTAWMNSKGHRAAMLNSYALYIGVGVAYSPVIVDRDVLVSYKAVVQFAMDPYPGAQINS